MTNGIAKVTYAIARETGSAIPRGELVIDRSFARSLGNWRRGDTGADAYSDTDLLIACCRLLRLDLVCIPADGAKGQERTLSPPATDISKLAKEGLFVFWLVDGAFQTAMDECGMMDLMKDMAQAPDTTARKLQRHSGELIAAIARGVGAGAHGIIIADDIAYGQGTYMSPDAVERLLFPLWQIQVTSAHSLGVPVFFHSDGKLNAVLPHIVAAGFDGLQCIEPAAGMDIAAIQAQYGEQLCLMGNIDPALLCDPSDRSGVSSGVNDLRRAVNDLMAIADGRGGLIFGTCSGLHTGMRPERVYDMYQIAAEGDPVS